VVAGRFELRPRVYEPDELPDCSPRNRAAYSSEVALHYNFRYVPISHRPVRCTWPRRATCGHAADIVRRPRHRSFDFLISASVKHSSALIRVSERRSAAAIDRLGLSRLRLESRRRLYFAPVAAVVRTISATCSAAAGQAWPPPARRGTMVATGRGQCLRTRGNSQSVIAPPCELEERAVSMLRQHRSAQRQKQSRVETQQQHVTPFALSTNLDPPRSPGLRDLATAFVEVHQLHDGVG